MPSVLLPIVDTGTLGTRLLPVGHITQPIRVGQLGIQRQLHSTLLAQRRLYQHLPIDTSQDIVHVDGRVDTCQERLQTAMGLQQSQVVLSFHVDEHGHRSLVIKHGDIASLNGAIDLRSLLQGRINRLVEGEGFSIHQEHSIMQRHLCRHIHLGGIGILRGTQHERHDHLFGQCLHLCHDVHPPLHRLQLLVDSGTEDALSLLLGKQARHPVLHFQHAILGNRPHQQQCHIAIAYHPRASYQRKAIATTFLGLLTATHSRQLLQSRCKPIGISHTDTHAKRTVGSLEQEHLVA